MAYKCHEVTNHNHNDIINIITSTKTKTAVIDPELKPTVLSKGVTI